MSTCPSPSTSIWKHPPSVFDLPNRIGSHPAPQTKRISYPVFQFAAWIVIVAVMQHALNYNTRLSIERNDPFESREVNYMLEEKAPMNVLLKPFFSSSSDLYWYCILVTWYSTVFTSRNRFLNLENGLV